MLVNVQVHVKVLFCDNHVYMYTCTCSYMYIHQLYSRVPCNRNTMVSRCLCGMCTIIVHVGYIQYNRTEREFALWL